MTTFPALARRIPPWPGAGSPRVIRWANAAALAAVVVGLAAVALRCFPVVFVQDIDPRSVSHREGHAYTTPIPGPGVNRIAAILLAPEADGDIFPNASSLGLLEEGKPFGMPHSYHHSVEAKGAGHFSHWGGELIFSTPDNSSPVTNGRRYAARYALAPSLWLTYILAALAAGGALVLSRSPVGGDGSRGRIAAAAGEASRAAFRVAAANRRGLFLAACGAAWLYANALFAMLLPAPLPTVDTQTYLTWSPFRTMGYPALLDLYRALVPTWEHFALFQLNLVLAGILCLAYAVARVCDSYLAGGIFVVLAFGCGQTLLSAADMMTEAPFTAFLMLHLGFLFLFLQGRGRTAALLAGLALAAAILVKSVATVLLGPGLLLLPFLRGSRRVLATLVIVPGLAAWAVPASWNLAHSGIFETSLAGGYALAGHVAWAIHPQPGSPVREEAARIERRLAPLLSQRPRSFETIEEYTRYTSNEYNALLWANMVPELSEYYSKSAAKPIDPWAVCTWKKCEPANAQLVIGRTLFTLSKEAIAHSPALYALHVLAHYYQMWRYTFYYDGYLVGGTAARAGYLEGAYAMASGYYAKELGPLPRFPTPRDLAATTARIQDSPWHRAFDFLSLRAPVRLAGLVFFYYLGPAIFLAGLVASLLVFRLPRLSPAAQAFCYAGLCVNAYCLGTALAQPVLARYAWASQGAAAALIVIGLHLAWRIAAQRRARTLPEGQAPQGNP